MSSLSTRRFFDWVEDHTAGLCLVVGILLALVGGGAVSFHSRRDAIAHIERCEKARSWALQCSVQKGNGYIYACEEEAQLTYRCTAWPAFWSGR